MTTQGLDIKAITVLGSDGNQLGQTTYGYTSSAVGTSGLLQHGTVNAGGPYLSTVTHWWNTHDSPVTTYTMYDTGMPKNIQDPKLNSASTITYQCQGSLPYDVANALGQLQRTNYDCASGVVTSVLDANDIASNRQGRAYDFEVVAGRPHSVTAADGGITTYTYPSPVETDTLVQASPNPSISSQDILDSYGRKYQSAQAGISTETSYDVNGRIHCSTTPHPTGASPSGSTCTTIYDALNRPISQAASDGISTRGLLYSENVTTTTDESGHRWKRTIDAFGNLTQAIELGTIASPTALETDYTYDGFGDLTTVAQLGSAAAGDTPRLKRTFTYDSLSQQVCASQPENNTAASCPSSATSVPPSGTHRISYDANGNVLTTTDPRGITATFIYDGLNRVTSTSYSDVNPNTPSKRYGYDGKDENGSIFQTASANPIGRLSRAVSGGQTGTSYSYDSMGRLTGQAFCLPSDCSYSTAVSAGYDQAGHLTDLIYPDGHHINQAWNASGQLFSAGLVDIHGTTASQSYLQSLTYWPDGSPNVVTLGNGIQQTYVENNRLQIQKMTVSTPLPPNANQVFLSHTYCYVNCASGGTANDGNIWQIADTLQPANTKDFTYDPLSRLQTFKMGNVHNQQYTTDSFGNLSPLAGTTPILRFDSPTNQITNLPCASSAQPYDAAGNQTCDTDTYGAARVYSYDADGLTRGVTIVGGNTPFETYTYAADGSRVRKSGADGSYTEYVAFGGQIIAERDQAGAWTDYIVANGAKIAKISNTDIAIHTFGANCPSCYGPQNNRAGWFIETPNYVVKPGDKISWRQYQTGAAQGGISIYFADAGVGTNWATRDTDGQVMNSDTIHGQWHQRTVDLNPYAGMLIRNNIGFTEDSQSGPGNWDIWYDDVVIYGSDGSIFPIYHAGQNVGLPVYSVDAGVSNAGATIQASTVSPAGVGQNDVTFFVPDHLGSPAMEFVGGGWPVWHGEFDPFGHELDSQFNTMNYKYAGLERDDESGLDHAQFRQYASYTGRWMSPDPYDGSMDLGNPQSLNRYSYVLNRPLSLTDPTGLDPFTLTVLAYCGGASGACAGGFSNPITATILGGIFVGAVVADLFTGGFFAHPAFHGSLKPRPDSKSPCTNVPKAPPGASASQNLNLVQNSTNGMLAPTKLGYVAQVFKTDGAFDYKTLYGGAGWGADKNQFVDYGNWNYGYTCGALYGSGTFCQSAGGINRMFRAALNGQNPFGSGGPFVKSPYGDQAVDSAQIRNGMNAQASGCTQ
jgi:RHS repeat-associated protein